VHTTTGKHGQTRDKTIGFELWYPLCTLLPGKYGQTRDKTIGFNIHCVLFYLASMGKPESKPLVLMSTPSIVYTAKLLL
jgi:hypothetical protein